MYFGCIINLIYFFYCYFNILNILQAQGHSTSPTKRSDYEYLDLNILKCVYVKQLRVQLFIHLPVI